MNEQLDSLGLTRWPFSPTPPPGQRVIWAGRPELRRQAERLVTTWTVDDSNALYLLWATWGMGKTHFLYFLRQQIETSSDLTVISSYCELPDGPFRFLGVYRQIVQSLPLERELDSLTRMLGPRVRTLGMPGIGRRPDVEKALWYLATDAGGKGQIAARWLQAAGGVSQRELNSVGISSSLRNASDAASALVALLNLISESTGGNARSLLLLDEYQRVGAQTPAKGSEVGDALRTVFNHCVGGLKLFVSLRSGDYDNVRVIVSPGLLTTASVETFKIDELDEQAAEIFILDLLSQSRPPGHWEPYYPFSPDSAKRVVGDLRSAGAITPRRLLQCLGHILSSVRAERAVSPSQPVSLAETNAVTASPGYDGLRREPED